MPWQSELRCFHPEDQKNPAVQPGVKLHFKLLLFSSLSISYVCIGCIFEAQYKRRRQLVMYCIVFINKSLPENQIQQNAKKQYICRIVQHKIRKLKVHYEVTQKNIAFCDLVSPGVEWTVQCAAKARNRCLLLVLISQVTENESPNIVDKLCKSLLSTYCNLILNHDHYHRHSQVDLFIIFNKGGRVLCTLYVLLGIQGFHMVTMFQTDCSNLLFLVVFFCK